MGVEFSSPEERAEYVRIFCEEAEEQLRTIGEGLLALRQNRDQHELAQAPYRAAHTLKGSAGYLDLEGIGALALAMEGVLRALAEGRVPFDGAREAALIEATEVLYRLTRRVSQGGSDDEIQVAPMVEQLRQMTTGP